MKRTLPDERIATTALDGSPPRGTRRVLVACTVGFTATGLALVGAGGVAKASLGVAASGWLTLCAFVLAGLRHHPHARFGAANAVTTIRAATTVLLVTAVIEAGVPGGRLDGATAAPWWWAVSGAACLSLALDGLDGPLARASGLASTFGARYDMETDALLALVLALAIAVGGELGPWILALGTLRYLFIGVSVFVPALRAPLYPSRRRKVICVVQIAALCTIASPLVAPPLSTGIGLAATLALAYSFGRDTWWLLRAPSAARARPRTGAPAGGRTG